MAVSETIPSEALPFAIVVLVYSFINALASKLVLFMRWKHGDRLSCQYTAPERSFLRIGSEADYVSSKVISLGAIVIFISIAMLMIQEVHYIIHWKHIRDVAYKEAVAHADNPSWAYISTYNKLDTIVFLIREFGGRRSYQVF